MRDYECMGKGVVEVEIRSPPRAEQNNNQKQLILIECISMTCNMFCISRSCPPTLYHTTAVSLASGVIGLSSKVSAKK
jgi:hypothetical protein